MEARPGGEEVEGGPAGHGGVLFTLESFAITVHILRVHRVIGTVAARAAVGGKEDRNRTERNGIRQFWSRWTKSIILFSIR